MVERQLWWLLARVGIPRFSSCNKGKELNLHNNQPGPKGLGHQSLVWSAWKVPSGLDRRQGVGDGSGIGLCRRPATHRVPASTPGSAPSTASPKGKDADGGGGKGTTPKGGR